MNAHVFGTHASGDAVYVQPAPQVSASPDVNVQSGSGSVGAHASSTDTVGQYRAHTAAEKDDCRGVQAALDALPLSPEHSVRAKVNATQSASLA